MKQKKMYDEIFLGVQGGGRLRAQLIYWLY